MPALELAIRANPKWAEPQFKIAALESDPARKIAQPEDGRIARSAQRGLLADAGHRAGRREPVCRRREILDRRGTCSRKLRTRRAQIHQAKLNLQEGRAEFEAAEKRRQRDEEARDLQRVKDIGRGGDSRRRAGR